MKFIKKILLFLKKVFIFLIWTWYSWPIGKLLLGVKWVVLGAVGKGWWWGKKSPVVKSLEDLLKKERYPEIPGWRSATDTSFDTWVIHHTNFSNEKELKKFFKEIDPLLLKGEKELSISQILGHNIRIETPDHCRGYVLKVLNKTSVFKRNPLTRPFDRNHEIYLKGPKVSFARNLLII